MTATFSNCNPLLRIPPGQKANGLGRGFLRTFGGWGPRIFKGADSHGKISSPRSVGMSAVGNRYAGQQWPATIVPPLRSIYLMASWSPSSPKSHARIRSDQGT